MSTHRITHVLSAIALLALTACGSFGGPDVTAARDAAAISRQIKANPEKTDTILKEAGTDRAAFEALLYDIAADPDASRAYSEAL